MRGKINMTDLKISMKPVKKTSLYLKISDAIYSYIQMNKLQPGAPGLPSPTIRHPTKKSAQRPIRCGAKVGVLDCMSDIMCPSPPPENPKSYQS